MTVKSLTCVLITEYMGYDRKSDKFYNKKLRVITAYLKMQ